MPAGQGGDQDRGVLRLQPQRVSAASFGQVAGVKRDSGKEEELPFEAPLFDLELRDDQEEQSSSSNRSRDRRTSSQGQGDGGLISNEGSESFATALRESDHTEAARTHDVERPRNSLEATSPGNQSQPLATGTDQDVQSGTGSRQRRGRRNKSYGSSQELWKSGKGAPAQLAAVFDYAEPSPTNL